MPKVTALKGFMGQGEEGFVQPGHQIEVDHERHVALAQNGLVEPPKGGKAEPAEPAASSDEPAPVAEKAITHPKRATTRKNLKGA